MKLQEKTTSHYLLWSSSSSEFRGTPSTAFWMVIQGTTRLKLLQKTKKISLSPVHLGLMLIGGCPSAYAMPLPHSRDAGLVSSVIWRSTLWRSSWTTLQYIEGVLKNA